jgi:hypothetical protein
VGERIDQLLSRARAVLRYRPLENAIETAIGNTGTGEAVGKLGRVFDKAFDDVLIQKQRYRTWLMVYSGLLLLALIYVARGLVRTYRLLGVANWRLQASMTRRCGWPNGPPN